MQTFRYGAVALVLAALLIVGFSAPLAELVSFKPDQTHSNVGFKVRHLGISFVRGEFTEYDALIRFDADDLSSLRVEATVEAASINTENERRDNHLRSDDFFNAEEYPTLQFVSTDVRNIDGSTFDLVGHLTIRDITKEVVMDGEFLGMGMGRNGRKAGFVATTTINRFDYNLKWDNLTEAGGLVVGEDVEIVLELELDEELPAEG